MEFFGKNSQVNLPFFMDNSTTAQGINFEGLSDHTAGLPSDDPTQINSNNSPNAKSSNKKKKKKKKKKKMIHNVFDSSRKASHENPAMKLGRSRAYC